MDIAPYLPDRFDSAIDHYVAHRLRYAPELLSWMLRETGTGAGATVLDLGCGPGFIGNAVAGQVGRVIGVDPSAAMIAAAQDEAPANATYLVGSSYDLSIVPGPVHLTTMGRSFHWMDRAATLAALDGLTAPGGAVAILSDTVRETAANGWYRAANAVASEYSVIDACGRHRHSDAYARHEERLLASAFSDLIEISVLRWHTWHFDSFMGYVLSRSGSTAEKLGDRLGTMEAAMRDALDPFGPEPWRSLHAHTALIARRPGAG
ncbi:MAG: methyltransferase domain-containing protein [Pseudomonadota bacterium]